MAAAALTCMELVKLVTDYLDGALTPADHARFEEHIAICADCTRYLAQMRETIRLTGALAEDQVSPEARNELLAAFRTWKQTRT